MKSLISIVLLAVAAFAAPAAVAHYPLFALNLTDDEGVVYRFQYLAQDFDNWRMYDPWGLMSVEEYTVPMRGSGALANKEFAPQCLTVFPSGSRNVNDNCVISTLAGGVKQIQILTPNSQGNGVVHTFTYEPPLTLGD